MENKKNYVNELVVLLKSEKNNDVLKERLEDYHESDIADAFEKLSRIERRRLYKVLGVEKTSEIFTYLENVEDYIHELDLLYVAKIVSEMDADDAVDILDELDDTEKETLIHLLDEDSREDIELIQSYDEDEIGSIMTTNYIEIKETFTMKEAKESLIVQASENDNISTIYVVTEENKLYGAIDLKDLLCAGETTLLEDIIITSYPSVNAKEEISDCIERIKDYGEDSIPVVNNENEILGVITAMDIVEVVDDELGEDYAKLAGLTAEEDLNETTIESMKKRMPWLIALLFLGMVVSSVVGIFEGVVSKIAIVVCFQSLILDMAGNVGTQSLAVTIRVLMDENLTGKQKVGLVFKEIKVGFCNGLFLGILSFVFIGLYVCFLKGFTLLNAFLISGCVGVSLLCAMIISSLVGTVVPMFFHKINVDPAVASGPLITTVNDLVAVITYYGLAWILLINILQLY